MRQRDTDASVRLGARIDAATRHTDGESWRRDGTLRLHTTAAVRSFPCHCNFTASGRQWVQIQNAVLSLLAPFARQEGFTMP